ncbi:MAG TPA: Asp-tRNA(Asn)/Glu-tRNA(Gln) amidotransferase subunit GatB [Candidatus Saccharimonadales bacterium]|nr:Asp-tRNA(Asn)/Glu-tRNA(Gln) amidotransferase subunit GatB [Candidatus Saccharimonadales bacterium]
MVSKEVAATYEPTIGIECHVQFNTKTKLFAGVDNDDRDKAPNSVTSPLCFGLPGTLPVLNKKALDLAVRAGLAMNAQIALVSSFDRKHYFYPDLPKGYQITQLDRPIVLAGEISVPVGDDLLKVRIHHAHLEEDAGKSTHPAGADYSLVDFNRAGTPLLEIVSQPDMHSALQAKSYAQELYLLMKYAGVTLGDLSRGNMRFDVNVSVAKKGAATLGTRTETKNLNSFRAVERAVEYEISRQIELLEKGEQVVQETRGWNEAKQKTTSQRSKEDAQDYRYFPEPDVPPVELTPAQIESIKADMPKLPPELRAEIQAKGIDQKTAETLILRDALTGTTYVQTVLSQDDPKAAVFAANYIANRDVAYVESVVKEGKDAGKLASAQAFAQVFAMRKAGELNSNNADALLAALRHKPDANVKNFAEELGFVQENNLEAIDAIITGVLAEPANQKAVQDVIKGEMKAIGFLVGQAMKASKGKANPAKLSEIIRKQLGVQ